MEEKKKKKITHQLHKSLNRLLEGFLGEMILELNKF